MSDELWQPGHVADNRRPSFTDQIKSNKTNYFIVRLKFDQRAGQLSLPHAGITETEKKLKRKTDEQINPLNGVEP